VLTVSLHRPVISGFIVLQRRYREGWQLQKLGLFEP
jgi:hypothetical protein